MIKAYYSSTGYRPLEKIKGLKIVDVGGATSFAQGYLDAIIEVRQPAASAEHLFIGDMNMPEFWEPVLAHVKEHGKWDYAICTHTLEDIINPLYVCRMMEKIALAGVIVEPSKYRELARFRFNGAPRGFMHHHWIFDIVNGVLTGFPKISHTEDVRFDNVHLKLADNREELIIEWTGEIGMKMINDGMPYEGDEHLEQCYDLLLRDEI